MRHRRIAALIAVLTVAMPLAVGRPAAAVDQVPRAGVGVVDATWHVGASAGQYASDRPCDLAGVVLDQDPDRCTDQHTLDTLATFDPGVHQTRRGISYGIQSRLSVRALVVQGNNGEVVQGNNGEYVAFLKNDLYIPQDLLWRRTAQILELNGSKIGRKNLVMSVSHNHSSPYYSSPSWGVWAFQDVFDIRFFEYYAQRQARAVIEAEAHMVPVRMGATVVKFDKTHRHSFGPQSPSADGTPAGYPQSDSDHDMMVARFDDISAPDNPKPLAIMANFGLHPEFLDGNDLITGDYIAPLERFVGRETGATLIFSQGSVGTAEPERSTYHNVHERLEFTHREYAQAEYGARLMADAVIDGWNDVASNTPETAGRFVGFDDNFAVNVFDRFFPGPTSHPLPTVSNCRTDTALAGNPQAPILGLPDCRGPGTSWPVDPGVRTDTLEAAEIPVPENYSAVSYTGLQEDVGVHLQAVKMGDLLVTVCSCEQWKDQSFNIKSRTERSFGPEWHGFDWSGGYTYSSGSFTEQYGACTQNADTWTCPRHPSVTMSDFNFRRMKAQIHNDASGWNDLTYVPWAESEPTTLEYIKGNFTHGGLPESQRYGLTIAMAMANDYNGYLASYREYQRGDHYRKALTGWGPHSEDYMATRLVQAGGLLNGGAPVPAEPLDAKEIADQAHNDARVAALGTIGATTLAAFEAALPADGGPAHVLDEPKDIEHFNAAFFSWVGGSNYTDSPDVRVERKREDGTWEQAADMSGEVVLTLQFPKLPDDAPAVLTGGYEYRWTATFEAFASRQTSHWDPIAKTPLPPKDIVADTAPGTYRFIVNGVRRGGLDPCPDTFGIAPILRCQTYQLTSREFTVGNWSGITVPSIVAEADGSVSFTVGPANSVSSPIGPVTIGPIDYPDTYGSSVPFIAHNRRVTRDPAFPNNASLFEWYCDECSFRPWADTGTVAQALVTIDPAGDGATLTVPAMLGVDGRYHTVAGVLGADDAAYVDIHGIEDHNAEYNGARSATVTG